MIILIALATFGATLLGGLFALKFKDRLHLILGFSAGAVIAVAFFDLLPEAIELTKNIYTIPTITSLVALGFAIFMILDRFVILHGHHEEEHHDHEHSHGRGKLGASSLAVHSFIDGMAIGIAFQVSPAVGTIVAVAVLMHDFSDGINTVNVVLKNKGKDSSAFKWLVADAIAPVLGVVSTLFFTLPESILGVILALYCGFFIYIGASDLLPESHHDHPTFWTTFVTIVGMGTLYVAIKLAGV